MIAKNAGVSSAAAGRAAFAQSVENAEQGAFGVGVGVSAADFNQIDPQYTSAATATTDAKPVTSTLSNAAADEGGDGSVYAPLSGSSITASITASTASIPVPSKPTESDAAGSVTLSESDVAAKDALRMLEAITQSKAESPNILQSAAAMLDSYA